MPHYRKYGKLQQPLTTEEFIVRMRKGLFHKRKHRGFIATLYYFAVRKTEALRATRERFKVGSNSLFFDVGKRLKHGKTTPPLNVPLDAPFANEIVYSVEHTKPKTRVWAYCSKTGYNIVDRVFAYPHYFRLSRITNFFLEGWTVAQVRSWTGLTLQALDYYVGMVDIIKMGESLGRGNKQ